MIFLLFLICTCRKSTKKTERTKKRIRNLVLIFKFYFLFFLIISFTESGVFCGSNIVDINELRIVDMFLIASSHCVCWSCCRLFSTVNL